MNMMEMSTLSLQADVGQEVLERYIKLEKEIAIAGQSSPDQILEKKQEQVEQLRLQIEHQRGEVENFENKT